MADPAKSNDPPVADGETLLRRVESDPNKFCFPAGPFDLRAFLPTDADTDGLSVFRLGPGYMQTPQQLLDAANNPAVKEYGGVAGFTASQLRSVKGDVEPVRDKDNLPGHCEIAALARKLYKGTSEQKQSVLSLAAHLARFARPPLISPKPRPPKSPPT